jgi:hypothetical protein
MHEAKEEYDVTAWEGIVLLGFIAATKTLHSLAPFTSVGPNF